MPFNLHRILIPFAVLLALDGLVWSIIFTSQATDALHLYFFDVGQGDSQMIRFPGGVDVVIDGGKSNGRALASLADVLSADDRYIDLLIMTHPQEDHFGGFLDILERYDVGLFIGNGRVTNSTSYTALMNVLDEQEIPYIALQEGDRIVVSDSQVQFLSPDIIDLLSGELNDGSLVFVLHYNNVNALFTGDIGFGVEEKLTKKYDLSSHILKVAHHGSKYSSGRAFLESVDPDVAIIGVGKNSFGHPTDEALQRLKDINIRVQRTDENGMVHIIIGEDISVFHERN
jgi:competence protein ComEC